MPQLPMHRPHPRTGEVMCRCVARSGLLSSQSLVLTAVVGHTRVRVHCICTDLHARGFRHGLGTRTHRWCNAVPPALRMWSKVTMADGRVLSKEHVAQLQQVCPSMESCARCLAYGDLRARTIDMHVLHTRYDVTGSAPHAGVRRKRADRVCVDGGD